MSLWRRCRDWPRNNIRWGIAILLMLSTLLCYLDRQSFAVAAPMLSEKFGFDNMDIAFIANGYMIVYAFMQPVAGRLIDGMGTRLGLALAVTWWSIANVLHALAGGRASFTAFRGLLGFGEAGNFPGAIKAVSEWFPPKERSVATGILNMGAGIGAVIAPPLVIFLITRFGWQSGFVVTGAVGFIWVALWMVLYHHPASHPFLTARERGLILGAPVGPVAAATSQGAWKEALANRGIWTLMAARFISDPGWFFYLIWLPTYLKQERGFSLTAIAASAWIPYLGADFGSIIGGAMSAYFVRRGFSLLTARKLAMCICAAMMPVAIPAVRADSAVAALIFVTIATTAHQAWAASLLTLPADLLPKRSVASGYGFTGMCGMLGATLFTYFVGAVTGPGHPHGYPLVFTIVGFLHPTAALLVVLFVRTLRNEGGRPTLASGGRPA